MERPVKELPWRVALARKDQLAGIKPEDQWYARLVRWFKNLVGRA